MGAIVGFVVGITNSLDLLAAARTGLIVAAMDSHLGTKRGDFLGEASFRLGSQAIHPDAESGLSRSKEAIPLIGLELVGEGDWGELSRVENLVGVGVADAAYEPWIGKGALEGPVFKGERGAKAFEVGGKDLNSSRIDFV